MDYLEIAVGALQRHGLTRDEAERFLKGSLYEKDEIIKAVKERAKREKKEEESWLPMSLDQGPPLPRKFGIKWPWREE